MEPVIRYRLRGGVREGVDDYDGEITWFSGGNREGTSRRRQSIKGGYRKLTTEQKSPPPPDDK